MRPFVPLARQKDSHETARLSQFLQNQERQARRLWRGVRGRVDYFQRPSQSHTTSEIDATPLATNAVSDKPQVVETVLRPMQAFYPPPPKSGSQADSSSGRSASGFSNSTSSSSQSLSAGPSRQSEPLAPISLFADSAAGVARPKKLSAVYAPFGRLIPVRRLSRWIHPRWRRPLSVSSPRTSILAAG
jgi:hypothetical protein